MSLGEELGSGDFSSDTREAIALTVTGINERDYCTSAHTAISKGLKTDNAEIDARLHGKSSDPKVQAILSLAIAIVEKRGLTSDEDLTVARAAGLSDADIVETIANVVANIFINYINHVAQTDIDFPSIKAKAA